MHILRGLVPVSCEGILSVINGFNLSDSFSTHWSLRWDAREPVLRRDEGTLIHHTLVPPVGCAGTCVETQGRDADTSHTGPSGGMRGNPC